MTVCFSRLLKLFQFLFYCNVRKSNIYSKHVKALIWGRNLVDDTRIRIWCLGDGEVGGSPGYRDYISCLCLLINRHNLTGLKPSVHLRSHSFYVSGGWIQVSRSSAQCFIRMKSRLQSDLRPRVFFQAPWLFERILFLPVV